MPTMADTLVATAAAHSDAQAVGFLAERPDPLRYDNNHSMNPDEVGGIIARAVPVGARVLDVGCGTGALSVLLRDERNAHVIGIEPDIERAMRADARGIETHAAVLSEALATRIGQVDVVVYADVLEHIPDPLAELRKAHLVLPPGGRVLISVPNVAHWSVRMSLLRGRFDYTPYGIMDATHLRWFTRRTIAALVQQAGFTVDEIHASALLSMACYVQGIVARVPHRVREPAVRWGLRRWPALFAAQHVVVARRRG
jgi:methionine biosynthesis protein MetW